jgi:hypothetical protein
LIISRHPSNGQSSSGQWRQEIAATVALYCAKTKRALLHGRYDLIVTNPDGQASGLPCAVLVGYEVMLPIVRK